MAAIPNQFAVSAPRYPGLNQETLDDGPIMLDILDSMANADTTSFTLSAVADTFIPPRVVVMAQTGGDINNSTPAATYACNIGDTLTFLVDDGTGKAKNQLTFTHSLVGVTNGSATAAQIAASINGDAAINTLIRAAAALTANAVTIAPIGPRRSVQVTGGTATVGIAFPGTVADAKKRTYVSATQVIAGGTGWSTSYVASTRVLTITNSTGGAVNRLAIFVYLNG